MYPLLWETTLSNNSSNCDAKWHWINKVLITVQPCDAKLKLSTCASRTVLCQKFISNNLLVFNMPWTCLTKCYSKEFFTGTSLLWTCNDVKEQKTFSIFNFFRLVFSRIRTRRPQLYFDPSQNTAGFKIYKIQYWPMFRVLTANWSQEFSHFAQKCNKLGLSWVFLSTWPMK